MEGAITAQKSADDSPLINIFAVTACATDQPLLALSREDGTILRFGCSLPLCVSFHC